MDNTLKSAHQSDINSASKGNTSVSTQEGNAEGFQMVLRKRSKDKETTPASTLPSAIDRKPFRLSLSKFVPIRNVAKDENDKVNFVNKGNGGEPKSSSTNQ